MDDQAILLRTALQHVKCTPSMIRFMVHRYPMSLNSFDEHKSTPLHIAINNRQDVGVIYELLKLGADVNARNSINSSTPLHCAIVSYNNNDSLFGVVRLLIKFGADANLKDGSKETPVHLVLKEVTGDLLIPVLNILLENGVQTDYWNDYILLANSACRNSNLNLEAIKLLLEFGIRPNLGNLKYHTNSYSRKSNDPPANDQISKLILQYVVVENMKNIEEDKMRFNMGVRNTLYDEIYLGHGNEELMEYQNALSYELLMMSDYYLGQHRTLFSFISKRCSNGHNYDKIGDLVYKVIPIFLSKRYVCCNDLFEASIKRSDLIPMLKDITIFAKIPTSNPKHEVKLILTNDAILLIASYLCKKDLLNLVLASWTPVKKDDSIRVKSVDIRKRQARSDWLRSLFASRLYSQNPLPLDLFMVDDEYTLKNLLI